MADAKISALNELTTPVADDEFPIVDTSATETKKITYANVEGSIDLDNVTEGTTNKFFTATDESKLDGLETNATHTGEVTGSEALAIADNIVDEANLKLDEAPTNDYVLTADSVKTGGMKWASVSTGDVIGPASATDNAIPTFDTATGKLIKDSGLISEGDKIYQEGYATSYIKFNNGAIEIWAGGAKQISWN